MEQKQKKATSVSNPADRDVKLTSQMKCAIGEQLVSTQLLAQGWPTVNVNSSINNFKGIDLYCQHGIDELESVGIQVKTTFQGEKASIMVGLNGKNAADIEEVKKHFITPWVFVNVKSLRLLEADYYVLTAKQIQELVYGLHKWYLYGWERRPCTESLEKSPAGVCIEHILGRQDKSKNSDTLFDNPMKGVDTLNAWDNIWKKD